MKKLATLLLLILMASAAGAQLRLYVTLQGNAGADSVITTATLYKLPDSILITRKPLTQKTSFAVNPKTNYVLRISASGKKTVVKKINVLQQDVSLIIALQTDNTNLDNVTIVSRKPLMRQEGDKTIVDAEPIAQSSSNSYEVIERVPGAVTIDGNVYLNSSTPAVIQINGREVKLSAEDLTALLKSLPANAVSKIEVLRTPSAKYDAESSGGILNIVLKKGIRLGTNGNVNAEYTQGRYATVSSGFSINSNTKLKKSLSYQYSNQKSYEEISNLRFINAIMRQQTFTRYNATRNFINGGLDYEASKKLSFAYNARLSLNNNKNNTENSSRIFNTGNITPFFLSSSPANNHTRYYLFNNDFEAAYKIDTLGSEWKNEANITWQRSNFDQNYSNIYLLPAGKKPVIGEGNTISSRRNISYETDLTLKFKNNTTIETGGKLSLHTFKNNAAFLIDSTGLQTNDAGKTNKYSFSENVNAAYFLISKTFGSFIIKPGFRIENTNISGNPLVPYDTSFSIKRTDFFPNLYIRKKLFNLFGMSISANAIFRKSILRPSYSTLNPAPVYIDPFYYSIGNPSIKPQFTTTYEFNITAEEYPVFSIGVNNMKDIFTSVTYQDSISKIVYTTFDNLGKNKEFYVRGIVGIPPGKKYFFYAGSQHNFNHYQGLYNHSPLDYTFGSWMFFMFHSYKPVKSTTLTMFGFYRLKSMWNFYELGPFGMLNFSINKSVLKNKANIVLAVSDIFKTRKYNFTIMQGGINASGQKIEDSRKGTIKFIYNFGIKPKQEQKKELFQQPEIN